MSKEKETDNKMTVEKIKHLHDIIAEVIGCDTTVRDEGILSSAVDGIYQTFDGKELYPTLIEKACRLCFTLIKDHAFVDGNKRIGLLSMMTMLDYEKRDFDLDDRDIEKIGFGVAAGLISYEDLLGVIRYKKLSIWDVKDAEVQ